MSEVDDPLEAAHSALEVGLESGKTIGRSLTWAMVRMTSSVKLSAVPEVPSRMVGLALATVSARVMRDGSCTSQPATSAASRA